MYALKPRNPNSEIIATNVRSLSKSFSAISLSSLSGKRIEVIALEDNKCFQSCLEFLIDTFIS
jgi:phosphatidate phosphatase PAH1